MGVLNYIEKLRQKPEKHRYKILFVATFLITALIAALWLTISFRASLDSEAIGNIDLTPFSVIKDNLRDIYETIKQ